MAHRPSNRIAVDSQPVPFGSAALRVLLAFVEAEPDASTRAEMLAILRRDGHLPAEAA